MLLLCLQIQLMDGGRAIIVLGECAPGVGNHIGPVRFDNWFVGGKSLDQFHARSEMNQTSINMNMTMSSETTVDGDSASRSAVH